MQKKIFLRSLETKHESMVRWYSRLSGSTPNTWKSSHEKPTCSVAKWQVVFLFVPFQCLRRDSLHDRSDVGHSVLGPVLWWSDCRGPRVLGCRGRYSGLSNVVSRTCESARLPAVHSCLQRCCSSGQWLFFVSIYFVFVLCTPVNLKCCLEHWQQLRVSMALKNWINSRADLLSQKFSGCAAESSPNYSVRICMVTFHKVLFPHRKRVKCQLWLFWCHKKRCRWLRGLFSLIFFKRRGTYATVVPSPETTNTFAFWMNPNQHLEMAALTTDCTCFVRDFVGFWARCIFNLIWFSCHHLYCCGVVLSGTPLSIHRWLSVISRCQHLMVFWLGWYHLGEICQIIDFLVRGSPSVIHFLSFWFGFSICLFHWVSWLNVWQFGQPKCLQTFECAKLWCLSPLCVAKCLEARQEPEKEWELPK